MAISKASGQAVAPAAKGDLVVGSATNDAAVLAVGSANQVLTVDSSTTTGLKWAAASGDLVKTGSTTFTSVNSFSMDNVFSSTYGLYIIRITITNATAGSFGTFVYRAGGSTTGGAWYWNNSKINMASPPTQTLASGVGVSSMRIDQTNTDTTSNRSSLIYIKALNPATSDKGKAVLWENSQGANQNWWSGQGYLYDVTTSIDGFAYTQDSSGNITGKAEVYGYKL